MPGDIFQNPVTVTAAPDGGAELQKGDESGGSDVINRSKKTLWDNLLLESEFLSKYYEGIFIRSDFPETEFLTPGESILVEIKRIALSNGTNMAVRSGVRTGANIFVSGRGGLDTGIIAFNQDYAIWLIYNPEINKDSCIFSLSYTTPILPTDYTYKRLIGYVYIREFPGNPAKILNQFVQIDNQVKFLTSQIDILIGGTATSYTVVDASEVAGSNDIIRIGFFNGTLTTGTTGVNNYELALQHNGTNPSGDNVVIKRTINGGGETSSQTRNFRFMMLDQKFKYKVLADNSATIRFVGGVLNI